MDWRAYFLDFWLSIIKRKVNMLAVVVFIATYFRLFPDIRGLLRVVVFLFAYSSVYYYNDLIDYKEDRTRKFMPKEKLLCHGAAREDDYITLLAWTSTLGIALAFLFSPVLGLFTAGAIVLNHLRTRVKNLFLREVLLGGVEFLNFEAMWSALYDSPIPGLAVPVFVAYSAAYALTHAFYKLRSKPLLWAARQWWIWFFVFALFTSAIFSLPLVSSSVLHLFAGVLASAVYVFLVGISASRYVHNPEHGMNRIAKYHDLALLLSALLLISAGFLYIHFGISFGSVPVPIPDEMDAVLQSIDRYQNEIIAYLL